MWTTPINPKKQPGTIERGETLAISMSGRVGYPCGLGYGQFGEVRFGYWNPIAGVYARRRAGKKDVRFPRYESGRPSTILLRRPVPTNPRTEAQQAQRYKMRGIAEAWRSLTPEQKYAYNSAAGRRGRRGIDVFTSEQLKAQ